MIELEPTGTELIPCPFCGSQDAPKLSDVGDCEKCPDFDDCMHKFVYNVCEGCADRDRPCFVVCSHNAGGCGASGPYRATMAEAAEAWNKRAAEGETRAGNYMATGGILKTPRSLVGEEGESVSFRPAEFTSCFEDNRANLEDDIWAGCDHLTMIEKGEMLVNVPYDKLLGWLDRQAAITKREWSHVHDMYIAELTAEREAWRERCGRMLDAAQEVVRIGFSDVCQGYANADAPESRADSGGTRGSDGVYEPVALRGAQGTGNSLERDEGAV